MGPPPRSRPKNMRSSIAESRLALRIAARFPRLWGAFGRPTVDLIRTGSADEIGVEAGSMTYGAFLSIPPLLLLAVTAVEVFLSDRPDAVERLIRRAEAALPGLGELVDTGLRLDPQTVVGAGLFGVAVLVWAASGFAVRLRHALGAVFGTEPLGLVTGRLKAGLLGVPVLLLLAAYTGAASWLGALEATGAVGVAGDVVAYSVLLGTGVLVWTAVYRWMTPGPRRPSFRDHLVGGTAFTMAFLVLERFGAVYVASVVVRSRALYGAIGALFGLFAFLYLAMWLFLLGGELTKLRRSPFAARERTSR